MSRKTPYVLSTRVSPAARDRILKAANKFGRPVSVMLSAAVDAYLAGDNDASAVLLGREGDPEKIAEELAEILGTEATPAALRRAIDELFAQLEPSSDPTAGVAESPPAKTLSANARRYVTGLRGQPAALRHRALSRDELAYCRKNKITETEFRSRVAAVNVRRVK
jgi:hypothetical protein